MAFIDKLEHISFYKDDMVGVFANQPIEFENRVFGNKRHDKPSAKFVDPDLCCQMLGDVAAIVDRLPHLNLHIVLNRPAAEYPPNHAFSQWQQHLYGNRVKYVIHVLSSVMPLERMSFEVEEIAKDFSPQRLASQADSPKEAQKVEKIAAAELVFKFHDPKRSSLPYEQEAAKNQAATRGRARLSWIHQPQDTGPSTSVLDEHFKQEQGKNATPIKNPRRNGSPQSPPSGRRGGKGRR